MLKTGNITRERKMKKLRLLLFTNCDRSCAGCCNKDWDTLALPSVGLLYPYDLVLLTGGEPLLFPQIVREAIQDIRFYSKAKVIVYTAMTKKIGRFQDILGRADGMTVTLHEQKDVADFERMLEKIPPEEFSGKSMRLNVFKGVGVEHPEGWQVKDQIEWVKDCPLPDDEVFMRYY